MAQNPVSMPIRRARGLSGRVRGRGRQHTRRVSMPFRRARGLSALPPSRRLHHGARAVSMPFRRARGLSEKIMKYTTLFLFILFQCPLGGLEDCRLATLATVSVATESSFQCPLGGRWDCRGQPLPSRHAGSHRVSMPFRRAVGLSASVATSSAGETQTCFNAL